MIDLILSKTKESLTRAKSAIEISDFFLPFGFCLILFFHFICFFLGGNFLYQSLSILGAFFVLIGLFDYYEHRIYKKFEHLSFSEKKAISSLMTLSSARLFFLVLYGLVSIVCVGIFLFQEGSFDCFSVKAITISVLFFIVALSLIQDLVFKGRNFSDLSDSHEGDVP